MKNHNKFIHFFALFFLLIYTSTSTLFANNQQFFNDVTKSDWYYSYLSDLRNDNIINGFPDGSFKGNTTLQIDQTIKMLTKSYGFSLQNSNGYWANNYINKAKELNWLSGLSISDYTKPISRFETCKILINSFSDTIEYPTNLTDYKIFIKDFESIPEDYKVDVLKVYSLGIISGYPDGTFQGNNTLTRAESSAIIVRLLNPLKRLVTLNPEEIQKLKEILLDNEVLNTYTYLSDYIKLENNKLYYMDENNNWLSIYQSKLNTNVALLSEKTLSNTLLYIYENKMTDYKLTGGYSYNSFRMSLLDNVESTVFQLVSNDNSDIITINIGGLIYEDSDDLDSNVLSLLNETCTFIESEENSLYEYILEKYNDKFNIPKDGVSTIISDMNVLIKVDYDNFSIQISLN